MDGLLSKVINSVQSSDCAFCRYITGNDTGKTGSHQCGFYIPKEAARLLFEKPVAKGENKDKWIEIVWQGDLTTQSRFVYYGVGTRNEFRITRFGKDFPWLSDEHVGDLLVIDRRSEEQYEAWILSADEDIDGFLNHYNLSPDDTNSLIKREKSLDHSDRLYRLLNSFVLRQNSFPSTTIMATGARKSYNEAYGITEGNMRMAPDEILLKWIDTEYTLFQMVEDKVYMPIINHSFSNVTDFVEMANLVLNRRKSRAGKSLEHHLASIFDANDVIYEEQVVTEERKRPDFIFPNGACYHNFEFPARLLVSLAAKTTCKDRWRQVINEANRISEKHLFTLQQAISENQLKEMHDEHVHLVVPRKYIRNYPKKYQGEIISLQQFISFVIDKQANTPRSFF